VTKQWSHLGPRTILWRCLGCKRIAWTLRGLCWYCAKETTSDE